jgi:SAM-dependent methyltransferase
VGDVSDGQALSFGAVADGYERLRPGYPAATVRWALGDAPLRVADVGAGTGKLTRVLRAAGHDVLAVEPDPLMRERLARALPGITVEAGSGEALPLATASVDAVTFAQAWHWVDPSRAVPEVARVLRPGGRLVLVWNLRDADAPFSRAVRDTVAGVEPALLERSTADTAARTTAPVLPGDALVPDGSHVARNDVVLPVDDAVALAGTWSYVALSASRDRLLQGLRERLLAAADSAGRVVLAQHTHAHRFVRA